MNKLYPRISPVGKFIQDIPVKNENGLYRISAAQGMIKCCIIVQPKIAAKPENTEGCVHALSTSR
jgi:hypothetical protein